MRQIRLLQPTSCVYKHQSEEPTVMCFMLYSTLSRIGFIFRFTLAILLPSNVILEPVDTQENIQRKTQ